MFEKLSKKYLAETLRIYILGVSFRKSNFSGKRDDYLTFYEWKSIKDYHITIRSGESIYEKDIFLIWVETVEADFVDNSKIWNERHVLITNEYNVSPQEVIEV